MRKRRRQNESGYALLLVFLMAAVIAISLYMEIPRLAFESQRQKEQLLIERGEQYKRAIQVFWSNNGHRYPSKIEDLESFNGRRFLRKRYIDPMTGKDEWRLIHIQGNMLTDSKTVKQQNRPTDANASISTNSQQYIGEQAGIGQLANNNQPGAVTPANRRRASDSLNPGLNNGQAPVDPNADPNANPQQQQNPNPNMPPQPGAQPGQIGSPGMGLPPGVPGLPGQPVPGQPIPGQPIPGQPSFPGMPNGARGFPGVPTGAMGMPGATGVTSNSGSSYMGGGSTYMGGGTAAPVNSQTGGVSPYPTAPGAIQPGMNPNFPQPGGQINPQQPNAAQQMIQSILTGGGRGAPSGAGAGPVLGGIGTDGGGFQATPAAALGNTAGMGQTIGGGIAGVASTSENDGIMVYSDRTNYSEWEFIFDFSKLRPPANPNQTGAGGTPVDKMGSSPASPNQPQPIAPSPTGSSFGPAPMPTGR